MPSWAARPATSLAGIRLKPRLTQWCDHYCRRPVTIAPGSDDDELLADESVELDDAVALALRRLQLVPRLAASAGNSSMKASGEVGAGGGSRMMSSGGAGKSSGMRLLTWGRPGPRQR
jgi:hypothetical protein